jgi:hypothetical protein
MDVRKLFGEVDMIDADKERKIIAWIERGTESHTVSTDSIMVMLNVKERELRAVVEKYRQSGMLIAEGKDGGYYLAKNWNEYEYTFNKRVGFALRMLCTHYNVRKQFLKMNNSDLFAQAVQADKIEMVVNYIHQLGLDREVTTN